MKFLDDSEPQVSAKGLNIVNVIRDQFIVTFLVWGGLTSVIRKRSGEFINKKNEVMIVRIKKWWHQWDMENHQKNQYMHYRKLKKIEREVAEST